MYIYIRWASPAVEKTNQHTSLGPISGTSNHLHIVYIYIDIMIYHDTDVVSLPSRQLGSCHQPTDHPQQPPAPLHCSYLLTVGLSAKWALPGEHFRLGLPSFGSIWHSYWTSRCWIGKSLIKGQFSIATLIEIDHNK